MTWLGGLVVIATLLVSRRLPRDTDALSKPNDDAADALEAVPIDAVENENTES